MIKNPDQEIQCILQETQDNIRAFLQDPPVSNKTYTSQDMVFDPNSGDAVFRELTAPAPPDSTVLYREVVERPPAYGIAYGIVAMWFDKDAQDAVLTNNLWEDLDSDHPYYGHDFNPVAGAMHTADLAAAIPCLDDAGNHTVYRYEFSSYQAPTLEITSYPNVMALLNIEAAILAPQVHAYLKNPTLFRDRASEAGSQVISLSTVETIAKIAMIETCDPHTAVIKYYLGMPAVELIAHHRADGDEQPLDSLALAQEAQERIQTYLWLLANE